MKIPRLSFIMSFRRQPHAKAAEGVGTVGESIYYLNVLQEGERRGGGCAPLADDNERLNERAMGFDGFDMEKLRIRNFFCRFAKNLCYGNREHLHTF